MVSVRLAVLASFVASALAIQRTCGTSPSAAQVAAIEADFASAQSAAASAKLAGPITTLASPVLPVSPSPMILLSAIGLQCPCSAGVLPCHLREHLIERRLRPGFSDRRTD